MLFFMLLPSGAHQDLHELTHFFPTRRSSDLHVIRGNASAPDTTVAPGIRGNHSGPVDPSKWIAPTPAQSAAIARRLPLAREGVDTECGSVAVFLASNLKIGRASCRERGC